MQSAVLNSDTLDCLESSQDWSFLMSSSLQMTWNHLKSEKFEKKQNIFNFSVSTGPADDPAPFGAKPSAGTVLTTFPREATRDFQQEVPINSSL